MADDNNKSVFSEDSDNNQSIEDIIAEQQADESNEDKFLKGEENKKKRKRALLVLLVVAAVGCVGGGLVALDPFSGSQNVNGTSGSTSASSSSAAGSNSTAASSEFTEPAADATEAWAKDNPIPITVEDWQESDYSSQASDSSSAQAISDGVVSQAESNGLSLASGTLPPESAGFTSDLSQEILSDGTQNPMFSYWTQEVFEKEVGTDVERLLNPVFGEWENYQYPEYKANTEFDTSIIADMFTSNWLTSNSDKSASEYIPVYADWNSDNYGMTNLIGVSRWFGQVTSSSTAFTYDETTNQYTAVYTAQVKFTAWSNDQTKLEKTGTLTLNLVPAITQEQGNGSSNRVLIDSGTLKVDN